MSIKGKETPVEKVEVEEVADGEGFNVVPKATGPGLGDGTVYGRIRYMGDALETTYYGERMERGQWHDCTDPFVWRKALGNADIECESRPKDNEMKKAHRDERPKAQAKYKADQEAKKRRENRAADAAMGKG